MGARNKSKTKDSWCTPQVVVDALRDFNDGPFELDPCSNPNSIVGARVEWYGPPHTDGLVLPWHRGPVFVNPPYSDKLSWARKCHDEHRSWEVEIVALLPADTDTRWFQQFALGCDHLCFWRGRLHFVGDRRYPARHPSVLLYWGRRGPRFARVFGEHGWVTPGLAFCRRFDNIASTRAA